MSSSSAEWVFGIHTVQVILKTAPERIERLLVAKQKNPRLQKMVDLASQRQIAVEKVSSEELDKHAAGNNHQGVCALCKSGETCDEKWLYRRVEALMDVGSDHPPLLLILDGVTDPHNLGACLRSADAVGVDAVIIPKDNSVGLTPVVQKVASGAAEAVPLVVVTNLARCMAELQERGVWITGTTDQTDTSVFDFVFDGAVALAMGAEGGGLRRLTKEHCDQLVSIPMQGVVSSLNVSVATGVCLYEIYRQRNLS
jgi:23S rRNA (guanosine2251-2'-O)-methyltransferase